MKETDKEKPRRTHLKEDRKWGGGGGEGRVNDKIIFFSG